MRNLKKFLALVLAMMMAFSLMVTANAANEKENGSNQYSDKQTIDETFVEAVDVLYGMGVMTGDYGAFKGDQNVMRSEMAAVLYRLMTGDTTQLKNQLYADIAAERFKDVKATDWFAPYIGWCYDVGLMVGSNGYVRPWDNVTGYETLVMVLRAMGYGKNHEYTGAGWYVNASSDGTLVGLLRDVNNSHYAHTLSQYTRRDVVASIVFQGAQLPTVTWTPSLGYNKYIGVTIASATNNQLNPSLGEKNFGLSYNYGVIVGNQSTGESYTKVNFDLDASNDLTGRITDNCYKNATTAASNLVRNMDWTTDLRFFGHAVKVWYDYRANRADSTTVTVGTNSYANQLTTYALYDRAVLAKVVKATVSTNLNDVTPVTHNGALGLEAVKAGFTVDTTNGAFWNYAFGPNSASRVNTNATYKSPIKTYDRTPTAADAPYYLVISNNVDKKADLVIALDVTVTQISQSNTVRAPEFVSVNDGATATYFGIAADRVTIQNAYGQAMGTRQNILKSSLGTSSTTTLGANVAAVLITGTTGAAPVAGTGGTGNFSNSESAPLSSTYYHELFELTRTEPKTVVAHDPATGELTFNDGTTMKRSWLADTVADNRLLDAGTNANSNTQGNYDRAHAPTKYGTYTFTTDEDGAYIYWSAGTSTDTFIYATYLDYDQAVATSTFTYPLVGVIDGKMVKRNITNGTEYSPTDNMGQSMDSTRYNESELPKRDSNNQVGASVREGVYRGYYISDSGKLTKVVSSQNNVNEWKQGTSDYFGKAAIVINKDTVGITAVLAGADPTTKTGLYLNQNTVFHIVSGAGTESQKIQNLTGLAELLGESKTVTIHGDKTVTATPGSAGGKWPLKGATNNYEMIYWTQETFVYGQDYTTTAFAVKEVYIPAEAIERTGSDKDSTLYFVGDNTPGLWNNTGEKATLFTVYDKNGDPQKLWIAGWAGTGGDGANTSAATKIAGAGKNFFVNLIDTGDKTNGEEPVYTVAAVSSTATDDDLGIVGKYVQVTNLGTDGTAMTLSYANDGLQAGDTPAGTSAAANDYKYIASTFSQYIASIGVGREKLWNVEGAKVVNLNKTTYPNVTDLRTLNEASSLGYTSVSGNANLGVDVSAFRNADNAQKLDVIFVNA